jgi:hypothetical protein
MAAGRLKMLSSYRNDMKNDKSTLIKMTIAH